MNNKNIQLLFFYLLLFLFSFRIAFAYTTLDISVVNDNLLINSCGSQLQSQMGYKGYINGAEVFTTGNFGGLPCASGDHFMDGLTAFVASNSTSTPLNLTFDFYPNIAFNGSPTAHFDVYYDGATFTAVDDNATTSTATITPTGNSSVLFLPGFEGSRLYKNNALLWEPSANSDVENLFMNADGTSIDSAIYTKDVIDEAYVSRIGPNIYKSFIQKLSNLKANGGIADYSAAPYDWRLSLDDILNSGNKIGDNISYITATSSPYILQELRRLAVESQNGKVTIVAHSNGGLLAKALLKKLSDANDPLLSKIDKLILVSVPQLGTPSAITSMLHGYKQGIPKTFGLLYSDLTARKFGQNLPGAYNFLPSANYFSSVSTPPVSFDNSIADWQSRYGPSITNQTGLHTFLIDTYERAEAASTTLSVPDYLRDTLLTRAEMAHSNLDSWTPPETMQIIDIAGWGVPTTVSGVKYGKRQARVEGEPKFTEDGDGTTVTPSALWSNGNASTTKYWIDLKKYNKDHWLSALLPFNHGNIFETSDLLTFISQSITNSTTTLSQYISSSTPTSNDTRLVYSLHSPLSLDIYDDSGRHTGISTTTNQIEEQIPGTYFAEFGDVKYIFTDETRPTNVSMTGYDTGTFTFSISEIQNDSIIASTTFADIPTTPTTKVSVNVSSSLSSVSNLAVDTDGNGSADIILAPVINNVVTYTPPTSLTQISSVSSSSSGGSGGGVGNGIPATNLIAESSPNIANTTIPTFINSTTTTSFSATTTAIKTKSKTVILKKSPKVVPNVSQTAQVISSNTVVHKLLLTSELKFTYNYILGKIKNLFQK